MENQIRCMMFLLFVEDLQYQEVKVIQPRNRDLFLLSSVDTLSPQPTATLAVTK